MTWLAVSINEFPAEPVSLSPMEIDEMGCYKCGHHDHHPWDCPDSFIHCIHSPIEGSGDTDLFTAYAAEGQCKKQFANNDFKSDGSDSDLAPGFQTKFPGIVWWHKHKFNVKPKYSPVNPNLSICMITINSDSNHDRYGFHG